MTCLDCGLPLLTDDEIANKRCISCHHYDPYAVFRRPWWQVTTRFLIAGMLIWVVASAVLFGLTWGSG